MSSTSPIIHPVLSDDDIAEIVQILHQCGGSKKKISKKNIMVGEYLKTIRILPTHDEKKDSETA